MFDPDAKRLARELRANEEKYISGELDLNDTLEATERYYNRKFTGENSHLITASEILPDSNLLQIQTELAKKCAKATKPDALVFNATKFSEKLKMYMSPSIMQSSREGSNDNCSSLWFRMGEKAKKFVWITPTFNFMYGTFDPEPAQITRKVRKAREKEKVGNVTQPLSVSLNETSNQEDIMIKEAERILTILIGHLRKNENHMICYFEFVIDPTSFARTVENMFILTLLMKSGQICIIKDENGLPFLCQVTPADKKERSAGAIKQFIISISMQEWQALIKKFNISRPAIRPRNRNAENGAGRNDV